jgi:hypothetical protein
MSVKPQIKTYETLGISIWHINEDIYAMILGMKSI